MKEIVGGFFTMISNEQIKQKMDYDSPDCCAFDMPPEGVELALEKAIEMVTDSISCYEADPVSHMTRKRKVPANKVIKLLILKQGKSIRAEICEQMPEGEEFQASAFSMQRYKIKHEAIIRVLNLFNRMVKPKRTFNGYYLISCDGSDV